MSRDAQEAEAAARTSCPLCGGNTFTWGVARGRDWFKFRADNVGFWRETLAARQSRRENVTHAGTCSCSPLIESHPNEAAKLVPMGEPNTVGEKCLTA